MTAASQPGFNEHKAEYAAWRERMRNGVQSNKLIDLTQKAEPEPVAGDEWSADALFVASDDIERDNLLDDHA